ncbi:MAG: DUF3226 domain-containing protein [Candidatus Sumerlaeia bacterium]
MPAIKQPQPNQVLVEGNDDLHVITNLIEKRGIYTREQLDQITLKSCGSDSKLLKQAEELIKIPDQYERIAIIIDADTSPERRRQDLKKRLEKVSVTLPDSPDPNGFIGESQDDGKKVGIWMMPDNDSPGGLEDFLQPMVPNNDACWLYTEECVDTASKIGARFQPQQRLKARLHTFLAWGNPPGRPYGMSIAHGYLNHQTPLADKFCDWFQKLFSI